MCDIYIHCFIYKLMIYLYILVFKNIIYLISNTNIDSIKIINSNSYNDKHELNGIIVIY